MPIAVQIDRSAGMIFSTFSGEINEQDFRTAIEELPKQHGFDPTFAHIIDCSKVSASKISTAFFKNLAHRPSLFSCDAVQVVVAPQDYIFGLARMVQIVREQKLSNIQVVRSLDEAFAILKVDQASLEETTASWLMHSVNRG